MRKLALLISLVLIQFGSIAQIDTNILLISKIDAFPQFQVADGNTIYMMGFTELMGAPIDIPAPTLNFTEGDSVKLDLWNLSQGPPHTIHLHGLDVNQANDGVPSLSFAVPHDSTGSYIFEAPHPGTYIYHCHETSVLHVQAGMYGMVIIRPQVDTLTWGGGYSFHSEKTWMTSEIDTNWHVDSIINHDYDPGATTHDVLDYEPQFFLVNGRSDQQLSGSSSELQGSVGEIIYMRLANIGYCGNKFVFPAELNAKIISSDGRPLPSEIINDTAIVLPGERYGVLLEASSVLLDSIRVDYFSLNTGAVKNTQKIQVDISGYLGTNELDLSDVLIYPNPTSEGLTIRFDETFGEIKRIFVRGMIGQTLKSYISDNELINLDLKDLNTGSYFVEIEIGNSRISKLIIKH